MVTHTQFFQAGFIIGLFVIIGIGFYFIWGAIPYVINSEKIREKQIIYLTEWCEVIPCVFYIKIETYDFLVANNPVNVSISTGALESASMYPEGASIPSSVIRNMQNSFEGTERYFPEDYDMMSPDFGKEDYPKMLEALKSGIIHLTPQGTRFIGEINNLIYREGGEFDIGITITYAEGGVSGYGMGDESFALHKVMKIAPPQTLLQYRTNNITTGLAYAAIGAAFLTVGLSKLLDLILKTIF